MGKSRRFVLGEKAEIVIGPRRQVERAVDDREMT
jgi:hypothetical protein